MFMVHSQRLFVFLQFGFSATLFATVLSGVGNAGDHLAYAHFNPADPRPDFFELPHYNAWVPYRKVYNRPTYVGGHVAAIIEPTSQEAMAWKIAKAKGDYKCHRPGYIPTYYYPKPWEALSTGARPDRYSAQNSPSQGNTGAPAGHVSAAQTPDGSDTFERTDEAAESVVRVAESSQEEGQGVATELSVDIN